jgi:hypothetical protein
VVTPVRILLKFSLVTRESAWRSLPLMRGRPSRYIFRPGGHAGVTVPRYETLFAGI